MPFHVFRRHQKKLIAIFGILAMVAFLVPAGVSNMFASRGTAVDAEVVRLYGRPVYRSEVEAMRAERLRANAFILRLQQDLSAYDPRYGPSPAAFGPADTRSIVDALILKHEADALGMPVSNAAALELLKNLTNDRMTPAVAERIVDQTFKGQPISGEMILADIADQLRLMQASRLPGPPDVTPLDVFEAFREQTEKVAVRAIPLRVADFVAQVPKPTEAQVREFYAKFKDATPDPDRPTPGFTTPRRVRLEYVTIDGAALDRQYRARLTEKELRAAFEERKAELAKPNPMTDELPVDLFAADAEAKLTPRTFDEVRGTLETELADAKVQDEIKRKFDELREAMDGYSKLYTEALHPADDDEPAGKATRAVAPSLPTRTDDFKGLAAKLGVTFESTPLLTREELAKYPNLARSHVGAGPGGARSQSPAAEFFGPKAENFTPTDLADGLGRSYLAWKVEDVPPRTPPLEDVRTDVVAAWKFAQARPLARKAADALAAEARDKHEGDLKAVAGDRKVITSEAPTAKLVASPLPGQFGGTPRPGELPEFPKAGAALREAIFSLGDKAVAVAPDQPEATYYVLAVHQRLPANFKDLYAPFSERSTLEMRAILDARARRSASWMTWLRERAGMKPGWAPPNEIEKHDDHPEETEETG